MSVRNPVAFAIAALLMATALPVIAECSPAPAQTRSNGHLSPEQQAMMFMDAHQKLNSLPQDQRKAYKQQLRRQWASLSPAQKTQERQQLDAEWNALPDARKQKIEARIQQWTATHNGQQQ